MRYGDLLRIFPTISHSAPPLAMFPLEFRGDGNHEETRVIGLQMFPSVDGVELVQHAKLLGVILQDNFSTEMHVNYVLSMCSQRII